MTVTNILFVRDEGTVVVFDAVDTDTGQQVRFAADHRSAQHMVDGAPADLYWVEPWQIEPWQILAVTP
jgi:hypothetical protein